MSSLTFDSAFAACPLMAILRGLTPEEAPDIGDALVEAGFTLIEVPLNSPKPLESISKLAARLAGLALVGAGTVLTPAQVRSVREAGGQFVVSPNTNESTIQATRSCGMDSLPGYYTASEAFAAIAAGATALKLFPADATVPAMLKAQRAVLPPEVKILAVGGINPNNMRPWLEAGANGFGLGSNLYKPGKSVKVVAQDAQTLAAAIRNSK